MIYQMAYHLMLNYLNSDLKKINDWAFQCKMTFNPDSNKKAQEMIFSRKLKTVTHPPLLFNNSYVL